MSTSPNLMLRIDSSALAALFPEGTQARIDLQQAVMAEFLRKHIKPSLVSDDRLSVEIGRAKHEVITSTLAEFGIKYDAWKNIKLTEEARRRISEGTHTAIHDVIRTQVADAVEHLRGTIAHDAQAAVNRLVNQEINAAIKARIQEVTASILNLPINPPTKSQS